MKKLKKFRKSKKNWELECCWLEKKKRRTWLSFKRIKGQLNLRVTKIIESTKRGKIKFGKVITIKQ